MFGVLFDAASAPPRHRTLYAIGLAILGAFFFYFGVLYHHVAAQAQRNEVRHSDVIVVFGAAEYAGKPSPIYRARLDHAAELFALRMAPVIVTTGGAGRDLHFSEGQVGRDYLAARGIPEGQLIAETQGEDTWQSARRVAAIMRENGMKDCMAVSDGYHMFRIKKMLESERVTVYGAPRPDPHSSHHLLMLEEVFKYTLWKLHL